MEQLGLIGEMHWLIEAAIAKTKRIIELADRFANALRPVKRSVIDLGVVGTGTTHHEQLGRRTAREPDERKVPSVAFHRDVEPRTVALDQPQLLEQRGKLARRVLPLDPVGFAHDASALVRRELAAEIAEQARSQLFRLADVDDFSVGGEHAIDSRPILRVRLHRGPHHGELRGGRVRTEQTYF